MKRVLLIIAMALPLFATSAIAGQWDGDWTVKVKSKYPFTLPFKVKGKKVSVDTFGRSQATAVSSATFDGLKISFTITFNSTKGGKCGDGSKGTYAAKFGKKGTWSYDCKGIAVGTVRTGKVKKKNKEN